MPVLSWFFAIGSLSSRNSGLRSRSSQTANTGSKLSFRQSQDANVESSAAPVSTRAPRASSSSSSWSPLRAFVPPVRQTWP